MSPGRVGSSSSPASASAPTIPGASNAPSASNDACASTTGSKPIRPQPTRPAQTSNLRRTPSSYYQPLISIAPALRSALEDVVTLREVSHEGGVGVLALGQRDQLLHVGVESARAEDREELRAGGARDL